MTSQRSAASVRTQFLNVSHQPAPSRAARVGAMAVPRRAMEWSRDFVLEFIEVYRELPCLWKVTSPEYKDRDKKNQAYKVLLEKGREISPDLTLDGVKAKINTLRTQFRKELTKVKAVSGTDYTYEPRLWCYSQLAFLADQEGIREFVSLPFKAIVGTDEEITHSLAEGVLCDVECTPAIEDIVSSLPSTSKQDLTPKASRQARKRTKTDASLEEQLISFAMKKLTSSEDEFDSFGKVVAARLRVLASDQRIFAGKIINDALYEGQLNQLSHRSRIVNVTGDDDGSVGSD
ncbi:uncharacterized protein [Panulirus ornatus]|uniref:uncharacterized protein n=1 Tax=Panulirus ornatus TaxID=150431 RepID=UPI003A8854ED